MVPSFHNADKPTHQRVMVVGLLFCLAFVVISFSFAQGELTPDHEALNGPAIFRLAICAKSRWR